MILRNPGQPTGHSLSLSQTASTTSAGRQRSMYLNLATNHVGKPPKATQMHVRGAFIARQSIGRATFMMSAIPACDLMSSHEPRDQYHPARLADDCPVLRHPAVRGLVGGAQEQRFGHRLFSG